MKQYVRNLVFGGCPSPWLMKVFCLVCKIRQNSCQWPNVGLWWQWGQILDLQQTEIECSCSISGVVEGGGGPHPPKTSANARIQQLRGWLPEEANHRNYHRKRVQTLGRLWGGWWAVRVVGARGSPQTTTESKPEHLISAVMGDR